MYQVFKDQIIATLMLVASISSIVFLQSCGEEPDSVDINTEIIDTLEVFNNIPENIESKYELIENLRIDEFENISEELYSIILPPSYKENKNKFYPVLYLLHPLGYLNSSWINLGNVNKYLDFCLLQGILDEMIVVLPYGHNSYYIDGYQENIEFETYFLTKFIPFIESEYRICAKRDKRFIAGASMGGYGALYYNLKYNDRFAYSYSMSTSVFGKEETVESLMNYIIDKDKSEVPNFTLDIGIHDQFLKDNQDFDTLLNELGIEHEFILRYGNHNWDFWREGIFLALNRIGRILNP